MRKTCYCLIVISLIGHGLVFGQKYEWVAPTTNNIASNFLYPTHITLDSKGNILELGELLNNVNVGIPGKYMGIIGKDTIPLKGMDSSGKLYFPYGSFVDLYLAKFDSVGRLIWALNPWPISLQFGEEGGRTGTDLFEIRTDKYDNVFIGGYNWFDANFYIAKYSPHGELLWCKCIVRELDPDPDTVAWHSGIFSSSSTNKPYLFYHIEYNGNIIISSGGSGDSVQIGNGVIKNHRSLFLAETDSNGNLIWEQQPYMLDFCTSDTAKINIFAPSLFSDKGTGFYMVGVYSKDINLQGNYLTNPDGCNLTYFASRYDSSGKLSWAKPLEIFNPHPGGLFPENQGWILIPNYNPYFSSASDSAHNLYIFVASPDSLSYDSFEVKPPPNSEGELYLLKYNMHGQKQWLKQVSISTGHIPAPANGLINDIPKTDLFINALCYVYCTFTVDTSQTGEVSFSIDKRIFNFDHKNSFLACFDKNGKLIYVKGFKSDFQSLVLTANNNGDVFMSGFIQQSDGNLNFDSLSISGNGMWIAKIYYPASLLPDSVWFVIHSCNDSVHFFVAYDIKPDSVLWQFGDGGTSHIMQPSYEYRSAGTYNVILHFYYNGLDDTTSMVVNTTGPAQINLGGTKSFCDSSTTLNAGQASGETYLWSNGDTHSSITVTTSGKYWVTATLNGCHASDTANITLLKPISFANDNIKNAVFCDMDTMLILDAGIAYKYLWSPNGDTTEKINITTTGDYSVVISGTDGCTASKSAVITDKCPCNLYIPNIFSPNHDNVNDYFLTKTECIPLSYTLQIYNRWGERLFQSNDINSGWDGTFKSVACQPGVYVYKIIYKFPNSTEQMRSGTVVID